MPLCTYASELKKLLSFFPSHSSFFSSSRFIAGKMINYREMVKTRVHRSITYYTDGFASIIKSVSLHFHYSSRLLIRSIAQQLTTQTTLKLKSYTYRLARTRLIESLIGLSEGSRVRAIASTATAQRYR